MNRIAHTATIASSVMLATLALPAPALANDDDVIRRGSCSGATDWKLKASPEDGRIEVEGEIDSNKKGQTWKWRLVHNGSVTARGKATTSGPSGSFDVERTVVDLKGEDRFRFRARHAATGETCVGRVRF